MMSTKFYFKKKVTFMGDDIDFHPSLKYVFQAREYAKNKEYEKSISEYDNSRKEIEQELSLCHDLNSNQKWNKMLREICDEREVILKIQNALNNIISFTPTASKEELFS